MTTTLAAADRIFFRAGLSFGPYSPEFNQGLVLARGPDVPRWPHALEQYFESGLIERLPADVPLAAGQRCGVVSAADIERWFREPTPPAVPVRVTWVEICQKFGIRMDDFDRACRFGLPAKVADKHTRNFFGGTNRAALFDRDAIAAWHKEGRALFGGQ